MSNTKPIIITLNAKSLFDYFPKKPTENDQCFKLDFSDPVHTYVVTQEITREDCPLFHQIYEVLKKWQGSSFQVTEKTLYDKFLSLIFRISFFPLTNLPIPNGNWKIRNFFRKMRRIWSSMGLIFIFQILTKLSICLHLIRVETWPGTAGFRSLMKLFTMN